MEDMYPTITTTHILICLIILFFLYLVWPDSTFKKLGIPGPKPGLLFGNSSESFSKGMYACDLEWIKKYGKIVGIYEGSTPMLLIGDVDIIKEIGVKQFSHFTNRQIFAFKNNMKPFDKGLTLLQDDHWKYVRSLMSPTFSAGKMKKMSPLIVQSSEILLKNMKEYCDHDKPANVKELYGAFLMDSIGATAFGLEIDTQKNKDDPFVYHIKELLDFETVHLSTFLLFFFPKIFSPIFSAFDINTTPKKSVQFCRNIFEQAINLKENDDQKHTDFLQLMLNAHKKQELDSSAENDDTLVESDKDQALIDSDEYAKTLASRNISGSKKGLEKEEIFAQSLLFFVAGYGTSGTVLSFMSYMLATHPEVQEKLIEEVDEVTAGNPNVVYETLVKMPYLDMVICETLRIYPPAIRADRDCKEDCTIKGVFIPKGMTINFSILAVHNDESLWPDPDKFIPERFSKEEKEKRNPYAWIPFGVGPRNCVGMRFALLITKIAFVKVLQNFTFEVCAETVIPPNVGKIGLLSLPDGINLKLQSRS